MTPNFLFTDCFPTDNRGDGSEIPARDCPVSVSSLQQAHRQLVLELRSREGKQSSVEISSVFVINVN